MKVMNLVIFIAIITSFTITFSTLKNFNIDDTQGQKPPTSAPFQVVNKRVMSRFLAEKERNPRVADHCNKDNEICSIILEGKTSTCCNNKCMDLYNDNKNCGACKKKCKFAESCCRGECVNLSMDKRHCGSCNNRCMTGGFCIYGICDYA
ncbi:hypothetical protein LIER_14250 [Lithospermum erythrorhizon]|uniref:Uncharacterized protein n=1 Tax=Lithospermum erythrorhizon TaxID=34254 RepID=A0AAV3Q1P8_LITER